MSYYGKPIYDRTFCRRHTVSKYTKEIEKRRKKIKALLEQDFKRKDICSQLDISIKTYKRDISFLKEQGLI